jgi:protein-S-isoprenylcysteine O-methyltransferase Ste14
VQTLSPEFLPITDDPATLRTIGAVLFTIGLGTALAGRFYLGDNWLDIEAAAVKARQVTVSRGIYRFVRHPIYSGDLILLFGLELALNSWAVVGVCLLVPVVFYKAVREESLLRTTLEGYERYCASTKRFIPFIA